ncbi:MAG: cell division protein FtsQ/DivIB [Thermoleophilaceae bacterium]
MRSLAQATVRTIPRLTLRVPAVWRRRLTLAALAAAALAALYMAWFRDSSFVRVEQVTVSGLTTGDAARVRAALVGEARDMTTLHVRRDRLERAVQGFAVVRSLEVSTNFPHGLAIRVIERRPAALLKAPGGQAIAAADGTLLHNVDARGKLPVLRLGSLPAARLTDGTPARALAVVAAAPPALAGRLSSVRVEAGSGLVARLRNGPKILFGSAERLADKWAAAASVLADPSSRGASYIDARLPERPVAGGLAVQSAAPVAPAGTATAPVPAQTAPQQAAPVAAAPTPTQTTSAPTAPQGAAQPAPQTPATGTTGGAVAAPGTG